MGLIKFLLASLLILASVTAVLGCYCDHYSWTPWSFCTKTCDQGTQNRNRNVRYDDYWNKHNCGQLCTVQEEQPCNIDPCPINCKLTDFGSWSDCSPCAKKIFRTRFVERPAQFGGQDCNEALMENLPCLASKECAIEELSCKDKFACHNGRCIKTKLQCNGQNDCLDNSDERDCGKINPVCELQRVFYVLPGVDLIGNGYDIGAEKTRGAVLDNFIMGDECVLNRSRANRKVYRIPANIESYDINLENLEDIKETPLVKAEHVSWSNQRSNSGDGRTDSDWGVPVLFGGSSKSNEAHSFKEELKAFQKKDSEYIHVHQIIATATFKTKSSDLYLSQPFLTFLHNLPLEYNYALYRQIFQEYGTHYFSSGTMGGRYDLLFQYDREELKSQGMSKEQSSKHITDEFSAFFLLYFSSSSSVTDGTTTTTINYEGSFMHKSEKSISSVRGGRAEYAAALAWEQKGAPPNSTTYKDWIESVIDNPVVIDFELKPIIDLVRGIPCAVTKRRHMQRAIAEYLSSFDSCKCAPCPNNGRPTMSGTECVCMCQPGTFGNNCEKRAKDFTSEAVDGYWGCWSAWTACDSSFTRRRTRSCNNPPPQRGGKPCQGPSRQQEQCKISIFPKKDVCISDDEFTSEGDSESVLPPGKTGCAKPRPPANSHLMFNKQVYAYGDSEEFLCFSGYERTGYQLIRCKQDGTWEKPRGKCIKKVCLRPNLPNDVTIIPNQEEYSIGSTFSLSCSGRGRSLTGKSSYTCTEALTWNPSIAADIRCKSDEVFKQDRSCDLGKKLVGSTCVCIPREDCKKYENDVCALDVANKRAEMMSICSFHANRCHGDKLQFINDGPCKENVNWAVFRASVSEKSSVKEPCGSDTCYEWERCTALGTCQCKNPSDCTATEGQTYCVKILKPVRQQTMNLCKLASNKCRGIELEILHEGEC